MSDAGTATFNHDVLLGSSGKIGIGIAPAEMLDIQSASGDARIRLDAPASSDTEIKFFNDGSAQYTIGHDDATDNFVIGGDNVDAPLVSVNKSGDLTIPQKIIHSGDTDTYLSFANADDFRIVAGNSTRAAFNTSKIHFNQEGIDQDFHVQGDNETNLLYVDASTDKVGIGTASPTKTFSVIKEVSDDWIGIFKNDHADAYGMQVDLSQSTASTRGAFAVYSGNGGKGLMVTNQGNVGIGTTTPSSPLDIVTNLSSDTQTTPETVLTLATKYSSTGANGGAGAGPRIYFKIPDDETNPSGGASIEALKENGDDSVSNTALAFSISQNDETLDEAMRITSDGKVGIGDTAPLDYLEINGSGSGLGGLTISNSTHNHAALSFARSAAATARIYITEPDATHTSQMYFQTSDASGSAPNLVTAISIDDHQNVGIGTTSPLSRLTFESDHWNTGTEDGPSIRWNNGITTADSVLQNFEDANVAPFVLGMNSYVSSGGSFTTFNNSYAASYIYQGASGAITMGTSAAGTATERINIGTGGLICIGVTTGYPGGHDAVSRLQITGGGSPMAIKQSQVNDASHRVVTVFTDSGGTYRGRITINNSACSFTSASDYRLKENIETLPNGLDRLNQLKPVKFKWKEHDYTSEGFIAHEVQEIYPDAVVGAKDDAVMQSMDYGKITPLLVKAIQGQQTIIDDLKARIETLEG